MSNPIEPLAALSKHFGFAGFRKGQGEVISAILEGHDTVVVMPTGSGKSLCYQLPALLKPGVTVVISPLIALMKNQVDALRARDIAATFINSSANPEEQKQRINGLRRAEYKLVYIAPERFRSPNFVDALAGAQISLFAIDEAHCISTWGHDFRPDYLRLRDAIEKLGRPQTAALTATATPYVRSDIIEQLGLRNPRAFVSGFDRPNLTINVVHTPKEEKKVARLKHLAARAGGSGIVYTSTRKSVEKVALRLAATGLKVAAYHAGMDDEVRERAQNAFMSGKVQIIVATNAFGMGIDKPDVRFVTHYHLPGSIEAFYQEIGRAGRDNLPATCELLFNYADKQTQDFFIEGSYPVPDVIMRVYDALVSTGLRRIELSTSEIAARAAIRNEMAVQSSLLILEKARHIDCRVAYRAARRARDILLIDDTPESKLRIRPQEIARRAALEQRKLREMVSFCYAETCYRAFILDYFGDRDHKVRCGTCGNCIKHTKGATKSFRRAAPLNQQVTNLDKFIRGQAPVALDLEQELNEQKRIRLVREGSESPGTEGHASGRRLSARPLTEAERIVVRKILSCAARMQGRFGKTMLASILRGSRAKSVLQAGLERLSTHGILADMTQDEIMVYVDALVPAGCLVTSKGAYPTVSISPFGVQVMRDKTPIELQLPHRNELRNPPAKKNNESNTIEHTYALYQTGATIEEISKARDLAEVTVEDHLARCIEQGKEVDVSPYISGEDRVLIEEAISEFGTERLRPIKDSLPEHITYRMVRFIVAKERKGHSR